MKSAGHARRRASVELLAVSNVGLNWAISAPDDMSAPNVNDLLSENAESQRRLRASEDRYERLVALLPVAVYTCEAPSGVITFYNQHAAELWGRAPNPGDPEARFCGSLRLWRPDGTLLPHDQAPTVVALREGRGCRDVEVIIERPDGTRINVVVNIDPILDADRRVVGVINVFHDRTALTKAEHGAALLAAIVDSSDDAIVSKNLNGIITSWNKSAERLFGYTAQEMIGRSVTLLIPPDRQDEEPVILARLRRGERVDHFDTVRVRKDGTQLPISLTISPVRDRDGRIIGASKIARDITDRKQAETALREADRRKDEFLATLSHELRNPLAPIRNAVQILKAKGPDVPELGWARNVIERQLQVMARLLEDLLDVSRISRQRLELRKERIDLAAVVEAALETSRPLIDAAGHQLTLRLPSQPLLLDADPVRLAQVLANLLNNAAKYTEAGGRIELAAERQGSDVAVSVKDNGIGIGADQLPHVFEIFAQSPRAMMRAQGGLGIGLSLVKGLVELHGGSIEARSAGVGLGSEFLVRLPLVVSAPDVAAGRPREGGEAAVAPKRRILIVDDNRDSADSLAMLLQLMGHEVGTAYDGEHALAVAANMRPDVVLLDIGMPRLNGYETCRRIREQPWGREALLIAVTGWGQAGDRRRTEEAGFDEHMVKPVDPAALMKLLASLPGAVACQPN